MWRYRLLRRVCRLLLRAIAIGRRRGTLKDTTLKHYHADLDRRLDRIMAAVPIGEAGRKLRKRIAANRSHLFVLVTNRCVPYTNNVSERNLRPSVIFRKVTNGFRCEWSVETYAAFRSVVSTAKANRASVLAVLQFVFSPQHYHGSNQPRRGEQLRGRRARPGRLIQSGSDYCRSGRMGGSNSGC